MKIKSANKAGNTGRQIATAAMRPKIQKILVTTDFSEESHVGVRYAVALAEKLRAAVVLLHVVEPHFRIPGLENVALAREDSKVTAVARVQLQGLAERETKGDLRLTSGVRIGNPFHEITTAAGERAADLIVIATHGYTGAKRVLLGSTAERVVRHAPCPVLTVPTPPPRNRTAQNIPHKRKKIVVPNDL
jgi:nucleotide-binding universal stress UspA family protein